MTLADSQPDLDRLLGTQRVMVVLRGHGTDRTLELAHQAWELGIRSVEVPIGRPEDVSVLAEVVRAGAARDLAVGAGTVITTDQVDDAAAAGAAYTLAPGLDLDVLAASAAAGLPHVPGVSTPSELQQLVVRGVRWAKAFPASALGPAWLSAMRGPFPGLSLVAMGGLDAKSAGEYLRAGARVVALGSALSDPAQLPALAELLAPEPA